VLTPEEKTMTMRFLLTLVGLEISIAAPVRASEKDTADPQIVQLGILRASNWRLMV
jgi:hypothetical protein